jgi:RNA polymerase sigma-70 factor (ECF subfamily)
MTYALLLDAIRDHGAHDGIPRRLGGVRDTVQPATDPSAPASAARIEADRPLVDQLRLGDATALEALMQRYFDRMARLAWQVLRSRDAAEDVAQEVFIRIWERRATLDPARSIAALLFAAVRNRALNDRKYERVREQYRTAASADLARSGSGESPHDAPDDDAAIEVLIEALPERQRTAIRLRFIEQLAVPEIASIFGVSANATHQLIFRALETLRRAGRLPDRP